MDSRGQVAEKEEEESHSCNGGLFAVVLEGINAKRTSQVEENSGRTPLLYMKGYIEEEEEEEGGEEGDGIYAVPHSILPQPAHIPRIDTWSARTRISPVHSNFKNTKNQYNIVRLSSKRQEHGIIEEEEPPEPPPKPPVPPKPGRGSSANGRSFYPAVFTPSVAGRSELIDCVNDFLILVIMGPNIKSWVHPCSPPK